MQEQQAKEILKTYFAIGEAKIKQLVGEVVQNYRITLPNGGHRLLKIFPPDFPKQQFTFETALLTHLSNENLPFETPKVVGQPVQLPGGRQARLQTWVAGKPLDHFTPIDAKLRRAWGQTAAKLNEALKNYQGPPAPTDYVWNPLQSLDCRKYASLFTHEQRLLTDHFWNRIEKALPIWQRLPKSLNYNDAHGENILVDTHGNITGVIDFGDAMYTARLCELAIACAYVGMSVPDPLGAIADVVRGYAVVQQPDNLDQLYDMIAARLLITVSLAAERARSEPENEYLQVSARPAWALLRQLHTLHPAFSHALFADAAGVAFDHPTALIYQKNKPASVVSPVDVKDKKCHLLDLSVGSLELGGNSKFNELKLFTRHIKRTLEDAGADFGYGGYHETRPVYTTDAFASEGNSGPRWRTVHLGLDIWGPAGTLIVAPLPGRVHSTFVDPAPGSYGPTIILEHELPGRKTFYTLYGHLSELDIKNIRAGTQVQSGEVIAHFGGPEENGGWPPHLHFQVMVDMLGLEGDFPGVAFPEELSAMASLCPNPYSFFPDLEPPKPTSFDIAEKRKRHLGRSLSVSYANPLHIVRGYGQYLYDTTGRRYLDTVNNVAHVGHEHPAVVEAIQRQAAVLNTNSRYLHENIVAFAEELTATLPPELSVVHFVNSGSEANELALRMCETWSGTRNMLAVEVGYHGNTGRTIDISSYKFDGKGGAGAPATTDILPLPDTFRGRHRDPATAGREYSAYAHQAIAARRERGEKIGGFIAESVLSCGGQIPLPAGYLKAVYGAVRKQGGLCIADEVQVGLGRVGSHWWGFELQGVVPDIVTIGKPIGNGHPLGAVVCTPAVAERFANGMEYFNTFGGNPVSCAAGRAVLRVVREEGLRARAAEVGEYTLGLLRDLQSRHGLIGDVRGHGLFLGIELVAEPTAASPHNLAPATSQAAYTKNYMRELGFLMSTDGPDENVLKIKPPMCFSRENAEQLVDYLDRVLRHDRVSI